MKKYQYTIQMLLLYIPLFIGIYIAIKLQIFPAVGFFVFIAVMHLRNCLDAYNIDSYISYKQPKRILQDEHYFKKYNEK